MEKKIISILLFSIFSIVVYINYNSETHLAIWNLIYYMQYYILVAFSMAMIWILFSNLLIRILTVPIVLYYAFHLLISILDIFNQSFSELIYKTNYINYGLSIGMALAIFIIPLTTKNKKE